jgi:hypothetical protein
MAVLAAVALFLLFVLVELITGERRGTAPAPPPIPGLPEPRR